MIRLIDRWDGFKELTAGDDIGYCRIAAVDYVTRRVLIKYPNGMQSELAMVLDDGRPNKRFFFENSNQRGH